MDVRQYIRALLNLVEALVRQLHEARGSHEAGIEFDEHFAGSSVDC